MQYHDPGPRAQFVHSALGQPFQMFTWTAGQVHGPSLSIANHQERRDLRSVC